MLFVNNSDFKELKFFKKSSKELICTATALETLKDYRITLLKNAATIKYYIVYYVVQLANSRIKYMGCTFFLIL